MDADSEGSPEKIKKRRERTRPRRKKRSLRNSECPNLSARQNEFESEDARLQENEKLCSLCNLRNSDCPNIFANKNEKGSEKSMQSARLCNMCRCNQSDRNELPKTLLGHGSRQHKTSRRAVSEPPVSFNPGPSSSSTLQETPQEDAVENDSSEPFPQNESAGDNVAVGESSDIEMNDDNDISFFKISGPTNSKKYLRGCYTEQTFSMYQLEGPENMAVLDFITELEKVLENLIKEAFSEAQPDDGVMVLIYCSQNMDHPITVPLTRFQNFKPAHIISAMEAAKMSGKLEFKIRDGVQFTFKHLKNPPSTAFSTIRGGSKGHKSYIFTNVEQAISERRCLVKIVNPNDEMCLARSVVVAQASNRWEKAKKKCSVLNPDPKDLKEKEEAENFFNQVKRPERWAQTLKALELCESIHITPQTKCGEEEIKRLEAVEEIYIKIVGSDIFDQIAYSGVKSHFRADVPVTEENCIYILRYFVTDPQGVQSYHYCPIIDIATYFGKVTYCHHCDHAFTEPYGHICEDVRKENWCFSCYKRECGREENPNTKPFRERCEICERKFFSQACETAHRRMQCYKSYYCMLCRTAVRRSRKRNADGSFSFQTDSQCKEEHVCKKTCFVCKKEIEIGQFHKCFIEKRPFKEPSDKLIFLDFETDQTSGEHIPVYCHLKYFDESQQEWVDKIFGLNKENPNIKNEVGKFIFQVKFKGYAVVAHNMRAFDGCFLLQYLAENGLKPNPIFSGQKITCLTVPHLNIRIIDSLNFLPMPLAQFPEAFGFQNESMKGNFPHFFTKVENFEYVGDLPPPEAYGIETMSKKVKNDFMKWYNEKKNEPGYQFDFKKEMEKYCAEDVEILRKGCLAFKNEIMEMTQNMCDPFNYVTLAAVAAAIYRGLFLKEEKIAAVPPNGYATHQRYSCKSLEWLEYLRQLENHKDLKHIANSPYGECEIAQYRFDGVDTEKKTVYEFNGCYYHGCPKCNSGKMDQKNPTIGLTFRALHEKTIEKEKFVKRTLKWKIITMWECEWEKLKQENEEILNFVKKNQKIFTPFSPFEAFHGGRVETFKMCIDDGETKLNYADFTSLYPFINATKYYPVGHPEIILSEFGSLTDILDRYWGLMKCTILPPKKLYIPVLPGKYGQDKKLIFTLCNRCATERTSKKPCNHSDEEREITGVWFTEEIKLAVEKGYQLRQVHGIHHFEEKSRELFADYIKMFYKKKLQASGRPENCQNDDDLRDFIKQLEEREGISLDMDDFSWNPQIRQVAKLLINSLWGRFGLRRNLPQHLFASCVEDVFEILNEPENLITNLLPLHENMLLVTYKKESADFLDINNDANIYIAAITTSYARIELYKKMDLLKERTVYVDTDGIKYIHEEGNDLETGPFLGELTNELQKNDFIKRFFSGGPKNYAYETIKGSKVVKVKGFTLTATNSESFSFENMKNILISRPQNEDEHDEDEDFDFIFNNQPRKTLQILSQNSRIRQQEKWRSEAFTNIHASNPQSASAGSTENYISTFNPTKIVRDKRWKLLSRPEQKLYTIMYDKRVVLSDFETLPYGY
jgi:hypothetical protein